MKELKPSFERKRGDDDLLHTPLESAEHACRLFKEMENEVREKVVCIHLTEKYDIISFEVVSIGTQTYAIADPVEILRGAVLVRAATIIVIHNHPLGSPEPSAADIEGARKLKEKARRQDLWVKFGVIAEALPQVSGFCKAWLGCSMGVRKEGCLGWVSNRGSGTSLTHPRSGYPLRPRRARLRFARRGSVYQGKKMGK